jgi:hypothetical protein
MPAPALPELAGQDAAGALELLRQGGGRRGEIDQVLANGRQSIHQIARRRGLGCAGGLRGVDIRCGARIVGLEPGPDGGIIEDAHELVDLRWSWLSRGFLLGGCIRRELHRGEQAE